MVRLTLCGLALALSGQLSAAQGPGAGFEAGLAKARITPAKPIRMAGYSSRPGPSQSVSSDLYAKAIALRDGRGNRSLLLTADILGFPRELSEQVCRRLKESTGLERKSILLIGAHNHCGPIIAGSRSELLDERLEHPVTDAEWDYLIEYRRQLEDHLVAIGRQAIEDLKPVRLSWGSGIVHFPMNRREFTGNGIILGVNPRGPVDRTVPVLRVEGAGGELRAIVFGAASHCTTLDDDYMSIDGEYAGYAQSYLEGSHSGVQAMFVTGCGGDVNPYPRGKLEMAREHGLNLGREVARVVGTSLKPVRGPLQTEFRVVNLPLQKLTRPVIARIAEGPEGEKHFFAHGALKMLDRGEPLLEAYPAPFALWQFGKDLTLVAYSGEPVVSYVALAEKALGPLNLWVAGYANDVYGYLPSAQILSEGSYETRGLYTAIGLFAPEVESVVKDAVVAMARSAGRPEPGKR